MITHCHVAGPGALGGLFAFRLKAAGFPVSLIGRNAEKYEQQLTLQTLEGEQTSTFCVEGQHTEGLISLLWVATKSYAVLEAVTSLRHRFTPKTVIITLGNGMGYHSALAKLFPGQLIAGSTTAGCSSPSASTRKLAGQGETRLGWWDRVDAPPEWFNQLQQAPWCSKWETNIENALLEKLAINSVINPMTALMNISNGALHQGSHKAMLDSAIGEVAALLHWSGHSAIAENLPTSVFKVISDTAKNSSSMRIDRQRLSKTEHEEILGYLLENLATTSSKEKPATPLLCSWLSALRQPYPIR